MIFLKSLTQEQYTFADMTMPQERVIIEGGAGTGKTFLALYVAKMRFRSFEKNRFDN